MITINEDFFNNDNEAQADPNAEPQKIKIGEEEFSPEEAKHLLDLGKIGKEAEEKYNTKLGNIWPEYTRSRQELSTLKREREEAEKAQLEKKISAGEQLTQEEIDRQVRESLKKYNVVFRDELDTDLSMREQAKELLSKTTDVVKEAREKYGINTDNRQILTFMQSSGASSPEEAFNNLFEPQVKQWQERELQKTKPQGLVTDPSSTAGSKQPTSQKPTKDTLYQMVMESIGGE